MGAKQSSHTKKTFIHVDRKERESVDDSFTIDPRLTKSWHGNSPHSPQISHLEDEASSVSRTPEENSLVENHEPNSEYEPGTGGAVCAARMVSQAGSPVQGLSLANALARCKDEPVVDDSPKATRTLVSLSECLGADKYRGGRMTDPTGLAAMRHAAYAVPSPGGASPHGPMLMMQMPMMMPMHHGWNGASPPATPTLMADQAAKVVRFQEKGQSAASADGTLSSKKKPARSAEKVEKLEKEKRDQPRENAAAGKEDRSTWTTRMLRNLPNDYSRQDLLDFLDSQKVMYDFVYLPIDWGKRANLGYAFVNLVSPEEAERIGSVLTGFTAWKVASDKVCEVVWGKPDQQSLRKNVERFRNSPVMHPDVPKDFKPLLFTLGQETVFPAPTKRLRPPRGFSKKNATDGDGFSGPSDDSD